MIVFFCDFCLNEQNKPTELQNYAELHSLLHIVVLHWAYWYSFGGYLWLNLNVLHAHALVLGWQRQVRTGKQWESDRQQRDRQTHREIERWWGFQGRQSVFFLWALERDSCHLQTKPHFLWLSPLKYSICQCHGPGMLPLRAANCVCWLCHSPIYIRHWQHHHCVPNVPLACSCSTLLLTLLISIFFPPLRCTVRLSASSVSQRHEHHRLLSDPVQSEVQTVGSGDYHVFMPKPCGSFHLQSVAVFFVGSINS